ncbi:hypothetical protein [Amphibacillus cookii]|uniref:hypothetical protein n=1 Tax=Amphibacillus cookii TaxID=767787 RepID=UPI0019584BA2|nr:hypothetical protein [Amphibacillus cookii]MBM7542334.1 hypothetical protein [Amphibacillus cookii]
MNKFLNLQLGNFFRAILSIRFLICSVVVCLIVIATIIPMFNHEQGAIDLLDLGLSGSFGNLMLILATIPLIPFTLSFASEHQQRAVLPWVIRAGVNQYAIGKLLFSLLSAFLTTALGLVLVVIVLLIWLPVYQYGHGAEAYSGYLVNGQWMRYLLFNISHLSLSSVLFAVIAFWVSTMIPNKFVTLATPVVCYYLLHRLTATLTIPVYFQAMYIFEATYDAGTPWSSFLLKFVTVLVISLPLAYLSVRNIKRRVSYG